MLNHPTSNHKNFQLLIKKMPYKSINLNDAAEFLGLELDSMQEFIKKHDIPYKLAGSRYSFQKKELHDWLTTYLVNGQEKDKKLFEKIQKSHQRQGENQLTLSLMVDESFFIPDLQAKTKKSILGKLADAADNTHLICDRDNLLSLLVEREELASTGMSNGIALPHTSVHADYIFMESFFIVGKVHSGIPFGSEDGKMTDLFFMPCSADDSEHLKMLGKIALLLQKTDLADELRFAESAEEMYDAFKIAEEFLNKAKS